MKKKTLLNVAIVSALIAGVPAITSCFGGKKKADPKVLTVRLYKAGWGDEWLRDTVKSWEAKNPGYTVDLDANYTVPATITKNLSSSKSIDDLYISTFSGWKNYAAMGQLAPLDDLMDEEVEPGVTVKDKVNPEWVKTLEFQGKTEKHVYRLPWTSGMGGIYYNKVMFEQNGWEVPTTTDELIQLVQTIKDADLPIPDDDTASVKPFTYSKINTDYFDYAVYGWWMQLTGQEKIEEFFQYDNPALFDSNIAGSPYANLQTAVEVWRELFKDPSNSTSNSGTNSNHDSQKELYRGEAAMCFSGDWIYNETLNYGDARDDFELAFMKNPKITGAVQTNISYAIGSDQFIAIPATAPNKDLAKSFIKEMISDENLANFTNKAHGFLGYKNNKTNLIDRTNVYVDSYLHAIEETPVRFSDISNSKIYLDGAILNPWVTNVNRPFERLLNDSSLTVEECFKNITKQAQAKFKEYGIYAK